MAEETKQIAIRAVSTSDWEAFQRAADRHHLGRGEMFGVLAALYERVRADPALEQLLRDSIADVVVRL